jgi:hypothetical protein
VADLVPVGHQQRRVALLGAGPEEELDAAGAGVRQARVVGVCGPFGANPGTTSSHWPHAGTGALRDLDLRRGVRPAPYIGAFGPVITPYTRVSGRSHVFATP